MPSRLRRALVLSVVLVVALPLVPSARAESVNGLIVFSRQDGPEEDLDIFTMRPDGSEVTRLTDDPADDRYPRWSPDGTRIVFESFRSGGVDVYVMNADGSEETRLTFGSGLDVRPDWAPSGQQIVFMIIDQGPPGIWLMRADGSDQRQLTDGGGAGDGDPHFSPDGRWIAFDSLRSGAFAVWKMRRDGTRLQQLTPDAMEAGDPAWSPDGKAIAFVNNFCSTCAESSLFLMRPDGTSVHQLTFDLQNNLDPGWSPNGKRIVFQYQADGPREIYVVNRDGTGVTNVTQSPGLSESFPDWQRSPAA
jgi:TolB protein